MKFSPRPRPRLHSTSPPGFTLPVVLFVLGGLLILALGGLLITGSDRQSARSQVDLHRAKLAARAALEDFNQLLRNGTANDDFLITASTPPPVSADASAPAPHLFLTRGSVSAGKLQFHHLPLFSSTHYFPGNLSEILTTPSTDGHFDKNTGFLDFTASPHLAPARAAWLPIRDSHGRIVSRYAYWAEDLQGKLDASRAGNLDGPEKSHSRPAWPFPAAGLPPDPAPGQSPCPALSQAALFSLDPAATESSQLDFSRKILQNRQWLISPESVMAAAELSPPLTRGSDAHLAHPIARAAEESLTPHLQPYLEQPLVPFSPGMAPAAAGKPKLNLNHLLATDRTSAVQDMADFIHLALPTFEQRNPNFPDKYTQTLCASALDYADADSDVSLPATGTAFRGIDSYPLVSEFLMRFRWENLLVRDGRKIVVLSATTYAELWNLCNLPISGEIQLTYETAYSFSLAANPNVSLADWSIATPVLPLADGFRWFPPQQISLNPNEYRLVKCGTITYEIDAANASAFIPSPLELGGEIYGKSGAGYRLKWNGRIVDQSRGGIHRNNCSLNYPKDTRDFPRQRTRATIPGHSHTRSGSYRNNPGDPRMAFHLLAPQDANRYPENFSPNRRNVRWGTVYADDAAAKPKIHGRVMPSEWPDGGHNSPLESIAYHTTDERVLPDDARFFPAETSILRHPPPAQAPQRISNAGKFYSVTELGHVPDPLMWQVSQPTAANRPWGDVTPDTLASTDHGGGNTLRIGRPEHPRFDQPATPGVEAWRLLDLFHTGQSRSASAASREGPLTLIEGSVNLNTADHATLRALAYGSLLMDPEISRRTSENHETTSLMAPPVKPFSATDAEISATADRIATAIVASRKSRPFASTAEISELLAPDGTPVFGDFSHLAGHTTLEMTDSAREECFARVFESTTVRSRHFRVWVVAQSLSPSAELDSEPQVLAEVRRAFTVFADPGNRRPDGSIDPQAFQPRILHETDF